VEHAVISCLQADSSSPAMHSSEAAYVSLPAAESLPPDVAPRAPTARPRAVRGSDARQTRVLMQALCEMRIELGGNEAPWCPVTMESRQLATRALWQNRERALYVQPDIERDVEARLDAGFRHARNGASRDAAAEFKRAYLLLCCVLAHARDIAR